MIFITPARIKKALLHPREALLYLYNYVRGEILRWRLKYFSLRLPRIEINREFKFFTHNKEFLDKISQQKFVIPTADKILNNEFSFLGSPARVIKPIIWNQDIKSRHQWPNIFYLDLRERLAQDYNKGWDIKMVWELSRFHYLVTLALAYYNTGEKKYLNKWQELISDWIKENPVYYGPNWINAMEVAIRSCNWIFSWEVMKIRLLRRFAPRNDTRNVSRNDTRNVSRNDKEKTSWNYKKDTPYIIRQSLDGFWEKFLSSLFEHGRFIYSNLEYAPVHSNHYLTDLVGLIYLGLFFRTMKEGKKWLTFAKKELEKEILLQVYPDGVDYELSTSYHRYKLELFLYAAWLLRMNGLELSPEFWERLEKMAYFTAVCLKPNGLAPLIGDNDDSRLHLLEESFYNWEKRNHNFTLFLYSEVTGKKIKINKTSYLFPQGGIFVFRDKNLYLITGRNKACYGKGGSHTHCDVLSFEVNVRGEDFIVDPGTYVYSSDFKERNKFRSTRAHNTVMIDNKEQDNFSQDPFWVKQISQIKIKKYEDNEERMILITEHNGYNRLDKPVIHQREFIYYKEETILVIRDVFKGEGKHLLEWNFHLAPQVRIWVKESKGEDKREIIALGEKNKLLFIIPQDLNCTIERDSVSPAYGRKVPSKTIRLQKFVLINSEKQFEFQIILLRHS